ncbi:hypothetical protein [Sphingomonas faeni]|uniref:hypothetical protein n=1 Tax=Sphingomonas faeni TaxID=185950 RepID=UPI0020C7B936|nr:hypothetical protein [Sphingomonas faeni]MCP8889831.1 hypothetical protein [Sphingomonas faeni]
MRIRRVKSRSRQTPDLGIALVSQMYRFRRFDAYNADNNPRFSAVFAKTVASVMRGKVIDSLKSPAQDQFA